MKTTEAVDQSEGNLPGCCLVNGWFHGCWLK